MTNLARHMQHKWLQGLGTKKSMIQSNWRKGYVEQMWLQMCFESRKCPGQAQIYWKIVPSTWTGDGKSMVADGWALLSRHQNFSHGEQPCANPKFETTVQNLKQKWFEIPIQIFGLIQMQISVGSVLKCCGCIIVLASVISPSMVQSTRSLYEKC